jgi:eukaryotic-like serine/threonine-protein kinase
LGTNVAPGDRALSKAEAWKASAQSGQHLTVDEQPSMPFRAGDVISGKYEIVQLLGTGGMGYVVAANHVELGEKVALKFLRSDCLANEELVGRFAREARASVKIKSEYVARVFDVGNLPDGAPFIVMEHLDGKDLYDVVHDQGPLPITLAVEYMMQACEALATAHAAGVVHRDIKPENLFLTRRAQGMDIIKVLDFGISKVALTGSAFESNVPLVKTMMPMGSPVYMSPEQIRASTDIDARTDIWSLGCVLFELLTGSAPFEAQSLTLLTATILEQPAPFLRSKCPEAPAELEALVARCLEKDPSRRFQDVGELAIALYPFAPRRARLSAERCCYVLRQAGLSQATLELSSIHPPSMVGINVGVVMPSAKPNGSTTGPSAISIDEFSTRVRSSRSSKAIAALLGVLVLLGAYAVLRPRSAPETVIAVGTPPVVANELPQRTNAPTVPAAVAVESLPVAPPTHSASPISIGSSNGSAQRSRSRDAQPSKSKATTSSTAKPASTTNREIDVGF